MAERRTHTMVTGLACQAAHVKRSREQSNKCEIVRRMFELRRSAAQGEKSAARVGTRRQRALLFGLGVVGVSALLLSTWFVLVTRDTERALPGVHVEGQDVSRLTRAEIAARVRAWQSQR